MNVIAVLEKEGLIDWSTILVGFKRWDITREQLLDYANGREGRNAPDLASIEGGHEEANEAIRNCLRQYIATKNIEVNEATAVKKLLLSHLIQLRDSDAAAKDKIEQLQQLYADFDYPDEMAKCSIYYLEPGSDKSAPLDHLDGAISRLREQLQDKALR